MARCQQSILQFVLGPDPVADDPRLQSHDAGFGVPAIENAPHFLIVFDEGVCLVDQQRRALILDVPEDCRGTDIANEATPQTDEMYSDRRDRDRLKGLSGSG